VISIGTNFRLGAPAIILFVAFSVISISVRATHEALGLDVHEPIGGTDPGHVCRVDVLLNSVRFLSVRHLHIMNGRGQSGRGRRNSAQRPRPTWRGPWQARGEADDDHSVVEEEGLGLGVLG
jgi:hypothetical protein